MREKSVPMIFLMPKNIKSQLEDLATKRSVSQAALCRIALTKFLEDENAA